MVSPPPNWVMKTDGFSVWAFLIDRLLDVRSGTTEYAMSARMPLARSLTRSSRRWNSWANAHVLHANRPAARPNRVAKRRRCLPMLLVDWPIESCILKAVPSPYLVVLTILSGAILTARRAGGNRKGLRQ